MSLPIKTTSEDVTKIIGYLKNKATGATISEAKGIVGSQPVDSRKLSAYVFWEIIERDGERLKLAKRGWGLARKTRSESAIYKEVIDGVVPYRAALEWAYHQGFDSITNVDVAAFWHEHHKSSIGSSNENTIKEQAVCFFRIADAAGIGKCIIGRKGNATRLDLSKSELSAMVEGGPSTPPIHTDLESEHIEDDEQASSEDLDEEIESTGESEDKPQQMDIKVFISHGKNTELVDQVETILGLSDIDSEVAVKEESSAIPVPDKVFGAMRRCNAGILIVSVEEGNTDADGNYVINNNVLIEIGAAFVLYDRRVILLWDKRLKVPSNLQGLYRCEFEGDDLNWNAGMKLMKAIKEFKKDMKNS
ncbi:nucleotide-binding protein [Spongiibacter taiwanensis]|uniref:TIR domain-containing protein n=1 Tax=Spongiibacter taiwanensis TaxID=1748242 RepID=UPI0020364386|nr:TIR domain-containing protein [Spongiibacter taiwanensis]USA41876.1 nucleotide-binding protein [Spongiibacter taiwanensis]